MLNASPYKPFHIYTCGWKHTHNVTIKFTWREIEMEMEGKEIAGACDLKFREYCGRVTRKKREKINNAPDICVQHIFIALETNYKWKYWAIYFNVV